MGSIILEEYTGNMLIIYKNHDKFEFYFMLKHYYTGHKAGPQNVLGLSITKL